MRWAKAGLWCGLWAATCGAEEVPFGAAQLVGGDSGLTSLIADDLDRDGDPDLIYASPSNSRVSWSRNDRGSYAPRQTLLTSEGVRRFVLADFDRDGRSDLVTVTNAGNAAWRRGLGPNPSGVPQFETRTTFSNAASGVTALAVGDFNRDGRPDLLVGRDELPVLQLFLFVGGSGSGFGAGSTVVGPAGVGKIESLATADLDGNGFVDAIVTSSAATGAPNMIAQLFYVPRASVSAFDAAVTIDNSTSPVSQGAVRFLSVVSADFDLIEGPDLAFLHVDHRAGRLSNANVVFNQGKDGFAAPTSLFGLSLGFSTLASGDLDRDGDADLVFTDAGLGTLSADNRRSPFFNTGYLLSEEAGSHALLIHDDDLDGDPDLFFARADGSVARHANTRVHGRVFLEGLAPRGLITAGNGGEAFDGPFEASAVPGGGKAVFAEITAGRLWSVDLGSPNEFSNSVLPTIAPLASDLGGARDLAWTDLGFDGDQDFLLGNGQLASGTPGNQNRLVIGTADGDGYVVNVLGCNLGVDIRGVTFFDTGNGIAAAYAADGNDRIAMPVGPCVGESLVSTAANGVPNGPGSIKAADLNGDGKLDLLVSARQDEAPPLIGDLVGWYPNNGDDSFGVLQRIGTVNAARDAVAVDFDRDGDLDVATASQGTVGTDPLAGRLLIFPNRGDGSFEEAVIAASGIESLARLEFSDIDHDGDIDIIAPGASNRARLPRQQCGVHYIEARGDGSFEAPRCLDLDSFARPYSRVALGDVNDDGVDDVVATSIADNVVAAFAGYRPKQLTVWSTLLGGTVIERNATTCVLSLDLTPLGRLVDSALAVDLLSFGLEPTLSGDAVNQFEVLRDDGDGLPEPGEDTSLGRAPENRKGSIFPLIDLDLDEAAPEAQVPQGATGRFWICVRSGAQQHTHRGRVLLESLGFVDGAGARVTGRFEGAGSVILDTATVFRDGLEQKVTRLG